jgi:2-polyprenyl-6-methoxyphenol hydroxylase-like FAD-dependent oxidoreductase
MHKRYVEEPKRKIEILSTVDVIVVGGGTSGVVAAIASARTGAKTMLIEKKGFLGGTIHGGVCSLHNFFTTSRVHGLESKQVVKGIPDEIVSRLVARGESPGHVLSDVVNIASDYNTIIDREAFKQLSLEMMAESGVELMLHTSFVDVIMEEGLPKGVIIENKDGRKAIFAKRLIDTSGDGDVAFKAGCAIHEDLEPYPVGRIFAMANVDLKKLADYLKEMNILGLVSYGDKKSDKDNIVRLFWYFGHDPRFKGFCESTGLRLLSLSSVHQNEITYINGINVMPLKDLSAEEMTRAEVQTREAIQKVSKTLIAEIPGFEKAYVSWTSPEIGVRRSRVIVCEHDLNSDEIDNCMRFDDEIGLYGYHDLPTKHSIGKGGYYGIPYRAILPIEVDNILVAGRMITSEKDAHMSTRNSVSCMIQGQAAGTAAALSIVYDVTPRELNPKILRSKLKEDNVILDI